ncbi:MAG: hypothetical protein LAT80_12335 [Balneolaceae bacterium]|nr:hypothetical protein [Balneolaceae bacterium]
MMKTFQFTVLLTLLFLLNSCSADELTVGAGDFNITGQFSLTVSVSPSDGGDVTPRSGSYEPGEEVSVRAVPGDGREFIGWSGFTDTEENPITIVMSEDVSLTARFSQTDIE